MIEYVKLSAEGTIHIIPTDTITCSHLDDDGEIFICRGDEPPAIGKYLGTFDSFKEATKYTGMSNG